MRGASAPAERMPPPAKSNGFSQSANKSAIQPISCVHGSERGGSGVAVGHEPGGLLVASQNVANGGLTGQGVVERRELAPGIAEHVADAVVTQPADEEIGGSHVTQPSCLTGVSFLASLRDLFI